MKNNQKLFVSIILIAVVAVGGYVAWLNSSNKPPVPIDSQLDTSNLPTTCKDEQEGVPIITSLSSYSGSVGTKLEINGCNFAGFEGDKNAWIENSQGLKGIIYGEKDSTDKIIKVVLKSPVCQEDLSYKGGDCTKFLSLNPGVYKIYVSPWDKESNRVPFTIFKLTSVSSEGQHCGGNIQNAPTCSAGYHCAPAPGAHPPFGDVGGICVKN